MGQRRESRERWALICASVGLLALAIVALWLHAANPRRPDAVNPIADPGIDPALVCPDTNGAAFRGVTVYRRADVPVERANRTMIRINLAAACQYYIAGGTGFGPRGGYTLDFFREADRGDLEHVASLLRKTGVYSRIVIHQGPDRYPEYYPNE